MTDNELAAIIVAARKMPWPYGGIVEFLALTGQRREEVVQASPDEIDPRSPNLVYSRRSHRELQSPYCASLRPAWAVISGHLTGSTSSQPPLGTTSRPIQRQSARLTSCRALRMAAA